jgi:hypothetical protein
MTPGTQTLRQVIVAQLAALRCALFPAQMLDLSWIYYKQIFEESCITFHVVSLCRPAYLVTANLETLVMQFQLLFRLWTLSRAKRETT